MSDFKSNLFSLDQLEKFCVVKDVFITNITGGPAISYSVYKIPHKTPVDVSFWKSDALLGKCIALGAMMRDPETKHLIPGYPAYFPEYVGPLVMNMLLGWDSLGRPQDVGEHFDQNDLTFTMNNTPLELLKRFGKDKLDGFAGLAQEAIKDYAKGPGPYSRVKNPDTAVRYLFALHPSKRPDYVWMTMRADVDDTGHVEHRQIQQSFKAVVQPIIVDIVDKERDNRLSYMSLKTKQEYLEIYPIVPHRMSMLMHSLAVRYIQKNVISITELYIAPLRGMLKILKQTGFVAETTPDKDGVAITFDEQQVLKLYNYFETAKNTIRVALYTVGNCLLCGNQPQWKCGQCGLPLYCKACAHTKENIHECI